MRFVVDPGHGSHELAGNSTPIGLIGPGGIEEKAVTLQIARAIERLLPGTVLTRRDDRNVTLGARADAARDADTFVSLHARSGRGDEIWIHPRSGPRTRAFAERLQRALGGTVYVGELAVLDPPRLGGCRDACLVELDCLHGDRRRVDQIAHRL